MTEKVIYVCKGCGSTDILFNAYAKWDEETQQMVLCSSYSHPYCVTCESGCEVEKVNLNETDKFNQGRANLKDLGF